MAYNSVKKIHTQCIIIGLKNNAVINAVIKYATLNSKTTQSQKIKLPILYCPKCIIIVIM